MKGIFYLMEKPQSVILTVIHHAVGITVPVEIEMNSATVQTVLTIESSERFEIQGGNLVL